MNLISLVVVLIIVGVLLWLIDNYIPMHARLKQILNIVVVIMVILWAINAFGVMGVLPRALVSAVVTLIVVSLLLGLINNYIPMEDRIKQILNIVLVLWVLNTFGVMGVLPRALVSVVVALIVVGLLLWLVNSYIPMDARFKQILNIVVIIAVILWLLGDFVVWSRIRIIRIGNP